MEGFNIVLESRKRLFKLHNHEFYKTKLDDFIFSWD